MKTYSNILVKTLFQAQGCVRAFISSSKPTLALWLGVHIAAREDIWSPSWLETCESKTKGSFTPRRLFLLACTRSACECLICVCLSKESQSLASPLKMPVICSVGEDSSPSSGVMEKKNAKRLVDFKSFRLFMTSSNTRLDHWHYLLNSTWQDVSPFSSQ